MAKLVDFNHARTLKRSDRINLELLQQGIWQMRLCSWKELIPGHDGFKHKRFQGCRVFERVQTSTLFNEESVLILRSSMQLLIALTSEIGM